MTDKEWCKQMFLASGLMDKPKIIELIEIGIQEGIITKAQLDTMILKVHKESPEGTIQ